MDIFGTVARAEANLTHEEIRAERERYYHWFEASGRYPRITRLMESDVDGVAARLERQRPSRRR
jgi:hypothetical protein